MPSRLVELEIARPGVFGVNTSASGDIMPKEYSVKAENFVFSDEGYLESRHGSLRQHATPVTGTVRQIFVTVDEDGEELVIFSTDTKIYKKGLGSVTDITGTITTPTAGNWKFYNHNNEIYGTQLGHSAIKLGTPSTGSFADAAFTGTDAPTESRIIDSMSAFGRVWHLWTDTSGVGYLTYSTILLPENYSPSGTGNDAGYFNLNASYLSGQSVPTAIAEFNGNLLVFTEKQVTVWENAWNPNAESAGGGDGGAYSGGMSILETIGGVGCMARDSIQYTQNDIIFLSEQGVTSLSRVVQEKSMPLNRYSDNIRESMRKLIRGVSKSSVWSAYLEGKGIYMIGSSEIGNSYLIDLATQLPDETYRCLTWTKSINCIGVTSPENLTGGDDVWASCLISDEASYLSQIKGYNDFTPSSGVGGSSYLLTYESAWSSIVQEIENNLKMPKRLGVVVKGKGTLSFSINLAFDYGDFIDSLARLATLTLSSPSRYGTATYNVSTYGGVASIEEKQFMGFGSGRIMKVKLTATVSGENISMQRVSIKSKVGKQS